MVWLYPSYPISGSEGPEVVFQVKQKQVCFYSTTLSRHWKMLQTGRALPHTSPNGIQPCYFGMPLQQENITVFTAAMISEVGNSTVGSPHY
jgi:hypothetical protein